MVPATEDLELLAGKAKAVRDLARVWRAARPGFTRELTGRQKGQLRHLARACSDDWPLAARAIAEACRNWAEFCRRAVQEDGSRDAPTEPQLGFLLAHVEAAVRMLDQGSDEVAERRRGGGLSTEEATQPMSDEERRRWLREAGEDD